MFNNKLFVKCVPPHIYIFLIKCHCRAQKDSLYEFVSLGGFVIIDDYGIRECKKAVNEFRKKYDIFEPIVYLVGQKMRMYWRVERKVKIDYKWYQDFVKTRDLDKSKIKCF